MHLSQAGHEALADEVARRVQRVLDGGEHGGGEGAARAPRAGGGEANEAQPREPTPSCLPSLSRLLCCKTESRWTPLEQQSLQ
jgi:hypothetical protein